jgi:uncharacterized membrane protein YidH (DUF202 family)
MITPCDGFAWNQWGWMREAVVFLSASFVFSQLEYTLCISVECTKKTPPIAAQ